MIDIADLTKIINDATKAIDMHSLSATQLLLGTAAVESRCGEAIWQKGGGPALGIWQVEPSTHRDCWTNWLDYRPDIAKLVLKLAPSWRRLGPSSEIPVDLLALVESPHYCCAIARVKYRRVKEPLPAVGDWAGFERYHKQYYNTIKGKTQPGQFLAALRVAGIDTGERIA